MKEICPNRPAECSWCGDTVRQVDKSKHESDCVLRLHPCPYRCGVSIPKVNESVHLKLKCKFRFVDCPNDCSLKQVRAADLEKHLEEQCENRLVRCPLGCCDTPSTEGQPQNIVSRLLEIHVKYECPERKVRCSICQTDISAKNSEHHPKFECPSRSVSCRLNGCIKVLPLCDREKHERFECRFRITLCPLGCGDMITFTNMGKHQQKHCKNRLIDCPLKCGMQIHHYALDDHMKLDCKLRVVSQADSKKQRRLTFGY